ncbi:MobC family plasmid mobilization relaxosome protein (plasmid) [Brachybacterium halotolerans subsp. kimchii]|uniref:plasmid mobilization protein n=1 Tax=Brachybacterium halotolerans TaxID=2795215 RepID=UPI001E547798|nr:plasmid mobilization relaxosome protein MobC [Brachybacterium halotolerans]UEJ84631.1 MobC family plasmid mobilization relaxosome protein [Brachybacterium halotolerans subsp. kimchii]
MADSESRRALFSRRRRANVEGGRQHFHKVRVSPEEEGTLKRLALEQNVTIPRFLVEAALSVEQGETPTERKQAIAELFKLHRLLAAISNNVNQIARATNATGEVQDEMRATLDAARRTAARIDTTIDEMSR